MHICAFFAVFWCNGAFLDEGGTDSENRLELEVRASDRVPLAYAGAKRRLELGLRLHWIKEWNVKTGLSDLGLAGVKQTLRRGWPVCGGFRWPVKEQWEKEVRMCPPDAVRDGHSVLLVGFRDDPKQLGGGVFIFRNTSGQGQDGFMPYGYAREYMNDAAWIDHILVTPPSDTP